MKALTIHQPYAQAIVLGYKIHETRGYYTNYRGPLAIHAGKTKMKPDALLRTGMPDIDYPTGAVVGFAYLQDCILMTPEFIAAQTEQERQLGFWQEGRYAWQLSVTRILFVPRPARGQLGLWNYDDQD